MLSKPLSMIAKRRLSTSKITSRAAVEWGRRRQLRITIRAATVGISPFSHILIADARSVEIRGRAL